MLWVFPAYTKYPFMSGRISHIDKISRGNPRPVFERRSRYVMQILFLTGLRNCGAVFFLNHLKDFM